MRVLLKLLSILAVWGVVGYMIIYVDPETIKDVGVEGLYLPFLLITILASWYTFMVLYRSFWVATVVAVLTGLALLLSILHYMSWFTGIVIVTIILFTLYLHKLNNLPKESGKGVESK